MVGAHNDVGRVNPLNMNPTAKDATTSVHSENGLEVIHEGDRTEELKGKVIASSTVPRNAATSISDSNGAMMRGASDALGDNDATGSDNSEGYSLLNLSLILEIHPKPVSLSLSPNSITLALTLRPLAHACMITMWTIPRK